MSVASQSARPAVARSAIASSICRRSAPRSGARSGKILRPDDLVGTGHVRRRPGDHAAISVGIARARRGARQHLSCAPTPTRTSIDRNAVDQEAVTSQAQIILSRDLAREVIDKLKLNELPEFDPALGGVSPSRRCSASSASSRIR